MQDDRRNRSNLDPTANKGCVTFVLVMAGIFVVAALYINWKRNVSPSQTPPVQKTTQSQQTADSTVKLKANVSFSGTQFVIRNNDSFDWRNVKMEINSGVIKSGYILKEAVLQAGKEYTVGAMQFAKGDGTRFNPFQMKPKNFSISCDTAKGKLTGFWHGGWE